MIKYVLLRAVTVLLCGFFCLGAFAQEKIITGIISDQNGNPLSGATVTAKGAKKATTTETNGAFKISVK